MSILTTRYDFNEKILQSDDIRLLKFNTYSVEWLDFIMLCRRCEETGNIDIVIGGVANDKVFNTLTLFFRGLIDKTESIRRLRYEQPNVQYCFRTQSMIENHLKFVSNEVIK